MNQYVTGTLIKMLRERKKVTQAELAERLNVSNKAVSKWETGKGYPDITLIEPLAAALGISVVELMTGVSVSNRNHAGNLKKMKFYVCPICGNILTAVGEAVVSCCGLTLQPLEAEQPDEAHQITAQITEDEYYITLPHEMSKQHYISFVAAVKDNGIDLLKIYPEQAAEGRFKISSTDTIFWYCNRHGLYSASIRDMI